MCIYFQYTTSEHQQVYGQPSNLTPTTLTNIDQLINPSVPVSRQSGFVPPIVSQSIVEPPQTVTEMTKYGYVSQFTQEDPEWTPAAKRQKTVIRQAHELSPAPVRRQGGRRPMDISVRIMFCLDLNNDQNEYILLYCI